MLSKVFLAITVATMAQGQEFSAFPEFISQFVRGIPNSRQLEVCPIENIHFELITGFVYSHAEDIIDSKVHILLLSECLDFCKQNEACQAVNFETGLCVLFKTSAGENSGSLAKSQFPLFTLYAQKICIQDPVPCESPWLYETVPGLTLAPTFTADVTTASTRQECALKCLQEEKFLCRTASFDEPSGSCILSQVDRNMAGRKRLLEAQETSDYLELSCVTKPERMCEFQTIHGKILKTVDAVYQDVESVDECRKRCLHATFNCYSYDFKSAGESICRLSHHSSATLAHIQEPYLEIENATTYEMKSCYQVTVECLGDEMVAKISMSTLFHGKVYAKSRPNSCVVDITNATEFQISLPYNDVNCDVVHEHSGSFSSNIVIQHHDMIVTSADIGLSLHCKYDLQNRTVTNSLLAGLEVKEDLMAEFFEETIIASPNVTMRITDVNGDDVFSAQVGDNLALRFEILDKTSPYEIFVREVVAMDGQDASEIVLIDERGCPTDSLIMQEVVQVTSGKILHVPFQGFKFPASDVVQFRGLVTPCLPHCEPVTCEVEAFDGSLMSRSSFGRKKREATEHDILVAQRIKITDNFDFMRLKQEEVEKEIIEETCMSITGIMVASAFFLLTQIVILLTWSYLWHKKRSTKLIDPIGSLPGSPYFGTLNSNKSSSSYLTN